MTQTDNDALVPCPFCGGAATVTTPLGFGNIRAIECTDSKCGAVGPWRSYENAAVVAWNTRAALRSPARKAAGGCYCKDTCGAPVIMGRQTRCLRNPPLRPGEAVVRGNEATRPQPAQDEVEVVARIIDPKIWAIHDDIAGRPDEADWFESWRAGSIKDGGAWGTSLAKATAAITALRQHSGESALREALEPFASFADTFVDAEGWTNSMRRERIVDWFGPSDFRKARAALGGGGEA